MQNSYANSPKVRLDHFIKKSGFTKLDNLLRNTREKARDEIFVTIEQRVPGVPKGVTRKYGYAKRTEGMKEVFDTLIRDRSTNDHINLIEWDTHYLMLLEDGTSISRKAFFVTKEAVQKLIS